MRISGLSIEERVNLYMGPAWHADKKKPGTRPG
jgi:hypothetical protein